jgi:hypothetical protein
MLRYHILAIPMSFDVYLVYKTCWCLCLSSSMSCSVLTYLFTMSCTSLMQANDSINILLVHGRYSSAGTIIAIVFCFSQLQNIILQHRHSSISCQILKKDHR